jgi:hypothetical protein
VSHAADLAKAGMFGAHRRLRRVELLLERGLIAS